MDPHVEFEIHFRRPDSGSGWESLNAAIPMSSPTSTVEVARENVARLEAIAKADPYYEDVETRIVRVERTLVDTPAPPRRTPWNGLTDEQRAETKLLTSNERRTYQSLLDRGFSHEDALGDALDGVDVNDVRAAGQKASR